MKSTYLIAMLLLAGCASPGAKKISADLMLSNATVYTLADDSSTADAIVITGGKIVATGTTADLLKKYDAGTVIDLKGRFIYPGFIDAHSHFYGLGQGLSSVDLRGSASEQEMTARVEEFYGGREVSLVTGRGWDQNVWESKAYPTNEAMNRLFPDVPVVLSRIDGHAALVNRKALDLAGITAETKVSGGEIIIKNGIPTGLLIDNAVELVNQKMPVPTEKEIRAMLQAAEETCFRNGLTTVCDAGVDKSLIDRYGMMHDEGKLKIRIYAMANPFSPTLEWLIKKGELKKERLHVRSVKYYMDGSMGSRGACLLQPYSDQQGHYGFLLNHPDSLVALARQLYEKKIQLNVHCIGDSANRIVLRMMADVLPSGNDVRWRIEHAQLVAPADLPFFRKAGILPSMQPTHATSDGSWVGTRIGNERLPHAYALKTLLAQSGRIVLGTDFPVEEVSPLYTFYAAVARKNPVTGFTASWLDAEKLTRMQALMGMTIWAAYAQFEEQEKGTIEPGKLADLTILDTDLIHADEEALKRAQVVMTIVNGEIVWQLP